MDDFVFSEFVAGNKENPFNVGLTTASVNNLPGLNGLGISASRIDIGKNGSVPMHFHPDASELFIIVRGRITAGFITPTQVYFKTLTPGDVIVFPKGLLHFQVNSGHGKAIAFAALTSSNPSMDLIDDVLFGNNLSTFTIEKTTLLDSSQIVKLKDQFGGSG
jgi:quercetin dioxygenase-like cupin family protein